MIRKSYQSPFSASISQRSLSFATAFSTLLFASISTVFSQVPPLPTESHRLLANEVGVWDATTRLWIEQSEQPLVSSGSETCEMLGGFWLIGKFEGEFGGMPFKGIGQTGYDTETNEYVSTWIDSMTADLLTSRGNYDAEQKTLTLVGEGKDWMTGKPKQVKMQTRYDGTDKKHFELHKAAIGSDEWKKTMEIDYVRRK